MSFKQGFQTQTEFVCHMQPDLILLQKRQKKVPFFFKKKKKKKVKYDVVCERKSLTWALQLTL